jgi:hypothetical protein
MAAIAIEVFQQALRSLIQGSRHQLGDGFSTMLDRRASHQTAERGFGLAADGKADAGNALAAPFKAVGGEAHAPAGKIIERGLPDDIAQPFGKAVRDMLASRIDMFTYHFYEK